MKNLIVTFFMLVGLISSAQEINKTDSKGKKQGEWKKYHENGMLRYMGTFKSDKPVGEFKYYYDTGKIQTKMTHFGEVSYFMSFFKTGEVQATGKYINQQRDSTWNYYDLNGFKKSSEFYIKGLKNRVSYTYYDDGKVAEEKEFVNDFEHGVWNQFFNDGKKKLEANYENGGLEGKATYYRASGKRSVSGYFYHGVRTGVWLYFEADGNKIKKKEEYKNGRRIDENKDDVYEKDPLEPIDVEDIINPENFISPR